MFEIGDLLAVAEKLLDIDAKTLKTIVNIPSAESALAAPFAGIADQMFYEHPVQRAAVLASRIIRNHPLPDGNKRAALYLMDLYLDGNGYRLTAAPAD
jgi:death-on-curing protein